MNLSFSFVNSADAVSMRTVLDIIILNIVRFTTRFPLEIEPLDN